MTQTLRHAARALAARPGFAILAVLSLAVGIGASTAMFGVLDAVLLKPLPYTNAERLTVICSDMRARHVRNFPFSPPDFDDLRKGTTAFQDMGAVFTFRQPVAMPGVNPEVVLAAGVTTNFLRLLGAHIELGRDFEENDATPEPPPPDAQPGAAPPVPKLPAIAILSQDFWRRRYGADRTVIGRTIDFGPGRAEVVGILGPMPLLFAPDKQILRDPDVWIAARIDYRTAARNNVFLTPVGRLKKGVSFAAAQGQVDTVAADERRHFPIARSAGLYFRVEPMQEDLVRDARPVLIAIMGAVTFLFLIACANVANLLLVRASVRERELAVRAALGGTRWHLIRQLLLESLALSAVGAAFGIGIARLSTELLIAIGPEDLRLDSVAINGSVLAFTILSALLAVIIFGLFPAIRASRPDLVDALRAGGRNSGLAAATLLRKGVVVAEVALSFVLLVGSGLMVRSLVALERTEPGFDPHNLLTFVVSNARGTPGQLAVLMTQLRARFKTAPGVLAVTASSSMPLDGTVNPVRWGTPEAAGDPGRFQAANFQIVLPGYFEAMRTRLLAGRTYSDADNRPDAGYIIVDDLLARKAFPHESAIGKRILVRFRTPEAESLQIIGVVAHQRDTSLAQEGREEVFVPDAYAGFGAVNRWAVRTSGDPGRITSAIRAQATQIDPKLLITEVAPMDTFVAQSQAQTRFALTTIGIFAIVAALLAIIGLYGVLAATVQQRTAEIGLRMALGAQPAGIFKLIVGQGLRLCALGVVAGILSALALTRVLVSLLVGVKPDDPITFVAIAAVFFCVAMFACWLPAQRAAALEPTLALRRE